MRATICNVRFLTIRLAGLICLLAMALPVRALAARPIKVLAIDVLSGPFKSVGTQYQLGVRFAVKQINRSGGIDGRPVKVFYANSELKPAVARRRALKYILNKHVRVIIAGTGSNVDAALAQLAEQKKVVLAIYAGEADSLTGKNFVPALFRVGLNTSQHTLATVVGIKELDKPVPKRFFLLNENYSFGHSAASSYESALAREIQGAKVVGEAFHPLGSSDFSSYMAKIQTSGAQAVLSGDFGPDLANMYLSAHQFGVNTRFGQIFLSDPHVLQAVGTEADGSVTSSRYAVGANTAQNRRFVKQWHASHNGKNAWPNFESAGGYDLTMFLADALHHAGSAKFAKLEKAWGGLSYKGLLGVETMRACDHQLLTPVAVGEIVKGGGKLNSSVHFGDLKILPPAATTVPRKETGNTRCVEKN